MRDLPKSGSSLSDRKWPVLHMTATTRAAVKVAKASQARHQDCLLTTYHGTNHARADAIPSRGGNAFGFR